MVRGVNGATASIVQSLQERCHLEHHIASKTTTVYPGPKGGATASPVPCGGKNCSQRKSDCKTAVIAAFKTKYGIDMSIAEQTNALKFKSFNDFFTRGLRTGVRAVDADSTAIVSPADGAISQLGKIENGNVFQAKGQKFTVENLIADPQLAEPFKNGEFATVYLSPRDYHRVHMPFAGTLTETLYVPGELFSVNQTTAENIRACLPVMNVWYVCLIPNLVVWQWF